MMRAAAWGNANGQTGREFLCGNIFTDNETRFLSHRFVLGLACSMMGASVSVRYVALTGGPGQA